MAKGRDRIEVMSVIYLVLLKKDKLHYVQDARRIRRAPSYYVVLCKVRYVCEWIKSRAIVNGTWRIRNKKLREHHSTSKNFVGVFRVREKM